MASDYKESNRKRRDARQTAIPDIRPPGGSKKNTKKWCRGKVGVKHQPEWVSYNSTKHTSFAPNGWRLFICKKCGRELDWDFPLLRQPETPK
jgi:hypothetical protein